MSVQPGMPEHRGLADRLKTLEAQVARLSRARSMQSTSLDGGTFRVKNGGVIELVDDNGDVVAELDKTGLKLDGILQPAIDIKNGQDTETNFSLTTSFQTVCTVTFNFEDWIDEAIIFSSAWGTLSATDETDEVLQMRILEDDNSVVSGPVIMPVPLQGTAGTGSLALSASVVESVSGSVSTRLQARNSTSFTGNSFGLSAVGIGFRLN